MSNMSSSMNRLPTDASNNENSTSEVPGAFNRRVVNTGRWFLPRRYITAFMLLTLSSIQIWKNLNIHFTFLRIIFFEEEDNSGYCAIKNWTHHEINDHGIGLSVAEAFAQLPGALFIYFYSSHKYFLISVLASSILHMLIPVTLCHTSGSFIFVLLLDRLISGPTNIAIITTWRTWAPPGERTKLVLFSLYGIFLSAADQPFYYLMQQLVSTKERYYLAGIAGIIWTLLWYNITSGTPQNDPLISEKELLYLKNKIPLECLQKVQKIPWKSIVTSKQVLILCLIFFKLSSTLTTLKIGGPTLDFHFGQEYNPQYFVPFLIVFAVFIPCAAVITDLLIEKFSGRSLLIRKIFLSGGFSLQFIFMFGLLAPGNAVKTIFMITHLTFAISLSGFITLPLDLSPRYVSIVCGFLFTILMFGKLLFWYGGEAIFSAFQTTMIKSLTCRLLADGIFSFLIALIFSLWGNNEEELWSLSFNESGRRIDCRSYPIPEDENDSKHVQEH